MTHVRPFVTPNLVIDIANGFNPRLKVAKHRLPWDLSLFLGDVLRLWGEFGGSLPQDMPQQAS